MPRQVRPNLLTQNGPSLSRGGFSISPEGVAIVKDSIEMRYKQLYRHFRRRGFYYAAAHIKARDCLRDETDYAVMEVYQKENKYARLAGQD